ncbi:thiamine transporter ThiT [Clostridium tepidiprofundi DSM 19306]|uniref:Thiamine transporter ThiT n=1 Tax=Clostridium tepidiprofundi DSM 19306 TaxID=1121338 RepID=A0A151B2K3_9CLOT|nr:energy-coupled thiamine transporter ThiT [Clostridium tepidiprofundi]KYH34141.1 thiamine transporter ThiT [Clostridium tepidiprofundi DSM 19306]
MQNFLNALIKNLTDIFSSPITIITLIGVLILLIALTKMKKIKFTTRMITQVGLAIALTVVLKMFKIYTAPYGGSVTIGSMVPILLISIIYGPELGFLTGFLYGLVDLIMGPYLLHPIQVLFDYPLPFMMLGIIGFFRNRTKPWILFGAVIAILARFACHYFAGVVFWGSYAPDGMSPYLYSLLYNAQYLPLDGLICLAILAVLPIKRLCKIKG